MFGDMPRKENEMHRTFAFARLASAVIAAVCAAGAGMAQEIGGTYTVQGTNFDGSAYGGTAEIVLTSNVTCDITWTTGATTSQGICMRSDDVFTAGYALGDKIGLIIYRLRPDGVLDGSWTVADTDAVGYEVLVPR